ncbi:hypothetical protein K450DRAFT_253781 [Umbelopsis ramanniana AG]|uniref:Uncharacterized protein n=1 Tax=Umbelopsis ramanniana AG TaxID=1314678 RepID=A0AAD5E5B0_UMBRA|nr:uncharacterized protein K450DRAFT_253781 [Umbelopsis ramanniana AG]KAI8577132.1 hypothetical protein K450DRAFT_253781 [Umbelopsis ramanniana AG]
MTYTMSNRVFLILVFFILTTFYLSHFILFPINHCSIQDIDFYMFFFLIIFGH